MAPGSFRIELTRIASAQLAQLESTDPKKHKKVLKTLAWLERDPRHPSLHTHEYHSVEGPNGEKVFEAYVENRTPAAYRLFWCYKKNSPGVIVVIAITPHP